MRRYLTTPKVSDSRLSLPALIPDPGNDPSLAGLGIHLLGCLLHCSGLW
jgi:hypothetical protein